MNTWFKQWQARRARDDYGRGVNWALQQLRENVSVATIDAIIKGGAEFHQTPFDSGARAVIRQRLEEYE